MIRTWHIVISGFTQNEGTLHGCQRLWLNLHTNLSLNGKAVVIQPPWDHNWSHLASRINSTSDRSDLRVLVYAYSWGVGNGLIKLANELNKWAINVDHAVLCDGVYHSQVLEPIPGIGHLMRGLGVLVGRDIRIPKNVRRVDWFRQNQNFPKGGKVVGDRPTIITEPVELPYVHAGMDDALEWHEKCLRVAGVTD